MTRFNLVDEPWIPCILLDGGGLTELGLRDVFAQARYFRAVSDQSPLVTAAIHRLLLAILCRNFQPDSLSTWKKLWQDKTWDSEALNNYLTQWKERFYLFDSTRPFYQQADFTAKEARPIRRLAFEFAAGNNPTLFDHAFDHDRPEVPASAAARWLLAAQVFSPTAGKSETLHTKDSPWSRGAVILVQGDDLLETLVLNLLNLFHRDFPTTDTDLPAWESEAPSKPAYGETPAGPLEYLTWQSRWVRLLPAPGGGATEAYLAQGRALDEGFREDPMLAYQRSDDKGLSVWMLQDDRALWRDSHALLNLSTDAPFQLPRALNRLATLVRDRTLDRRRQFQLQILGQRLVSGQPTIIFWRHERLPLPLAYLNNADLLDRLREGLARAEQTADALSASGWRLARLQIAPDSDDKSARQPDRGAVRNYLVHLGMSRAYWSKLEIPFRRFLGDVAEGEPNDDGVVVYGEQALTTWSETVRATARQAYREATSGLDRSARSLKALAAGEQSLAHRLTAIFGEMPRISEGEDG